MSLAKLSTLLSALAAENGGQCAACLGWHAPSSALGTSSGVRLPAVLSVGLRKFTRQALECAVRAGEDGCWKVFYCLGDVSHCSAPVLPQEHRPEVCYHPRPRCDPQF